MNNCNNCNNCNDCCNFGKKCNVCCLLYPNPTDYENHYKNDINKTFDDIVKRYSKKTPDRVITEQEREYYRVQREEIEKMFNKKT